MQFFKYRKKTLIQVKLCTQKVNGHKICCKYVIFVTKFAIIETDM